jgi:hypothetical protein
MSLTNEIKRLRKKLEIFDIEKSAEVMKDLIQLSTEYSDGADCHMIIRELKLKYQGELRELLSKQNNYKQGKLKL